MKTLRTHAARDESEPHRAPEAATASNGEKTPGAPTPCRLTVHRMPRKMENRQSLLQIDVMHGSDVGKSATFSGVIFTVMPCKLETLSDLLNLILTQHFRRMRTFFAEAV